MPLTGVNAPTTAANTYDLSKWEQQEGDPIQSNPLAATQPEPGSRNWGSVGVEVYVNAGCESADYSGVDGADTTSYGTRTNYGSILSTLRAPVNSPCQQ